MTSSVEVGGSIVGTHTGGVGEAGDVGELFEDVDKAVSGHLAGDVTDHTAKESGDLGDQHPDDVSDHRADRLQLALLAAVAATFLAKLEAEQRFAFRATAAGLLQVDRPVDVRSDEMLLQYRLHVRLCLV